MHTGIHLLLLQATQRSEAIEDMIILALAGIGIVFLGLLVIYAVMTILRRIVPGEREEKAGGVPPPNSSYGMAPAPGNLPYLDKRTVAIISAAAVAAVGRPLRVRRITFFNQNTMSGWNEAARSGLHSHTLKRGL